MIYELRIGGCLSYYIGIYSTFVAMNINSCIATVFGVGRVNFAPGTFGTLFAIVPFLFFVPHRAVLLFLSLVSFVCGVYSSGKYAADIGVSDPKDVVIDEVCGLWIALLLCGNAGARVSELFQLLSTKYDFARYIIGVGSRCGLVMYNSIYMLFIFCAFRFFDICKPFPISYLDENVGGGLGIMLDDIVAGVMSALLLCCIFYALRSLYQYY